MCTTTKQEPQATWPFPTAAAPKTKPADMPPLLWAAIEATRHPDWRPVKLSKEQIWWRIIV